MDESYEQGHQLRALAMRVAALEDNVAFLEEWCEEQQDVLDRAVGAAAYHCEIEAGSKPAPRAVLRVVDLRDADGPVHDDDTDADTIVALVETDHDRKVRQIRLQLNRLRTRLASSVASRSDLPAEKRPPEQPRTVSATPAGRTAP
jgi:uncharacterized coiled-coil protein SlyX